MVQTALLLSSCKATTAHFPNEMHQEHSGTLSSGLSQDPPCLEAHTGPHHHHHIGLEFDGGVCGQYFSIKISI